MSGWVEARAVSNKEAKTIALFIWEDVICRHRIFWRIVLDRGGEFKGEVIDLLNRWGVDRIQISVYHAPVNGIIERGYRPLKDALSKLDDDWVTNLAAVLFTD
jgi:CRISPR/Cas system-associated endoribonuclease Cas2